MQLTPVTLSGSFVRLEPLTLQHLEPLAAVAFEPELWQWTTSRIANRDELKQYLAEAGRAQEAGTALPFATVDLKTGQVVGSTRFANAEAAHKRLEIGCTFIAPPWQRTAINSEAKFLMLRHAFEVLGCNRVELKTDALNSGSRKAILRLGAREEGTLRSHMITAGGRVRDTVYFSILNSEWPRVAAGLQTRFQQPAS